MADVPVTKADLAKMGAGGLCLNCQPVFSRTAVLVNNREPESGDEAATAMAQLRNEKWMAHAV